jgi:hypothetical protein
LLPNTLATSSISSASLFRILDRDETKVIFIDDVAVVLEHITTHDLERDVIRLGCHFFLQEKNGTVPGIGRHLTRQNDAPYLLSLR